MQFKIKNSNFLQVENKYFGGDKLQFVTSGTQLELFQIKFGIQSKKNFYADGNYFKMSLYLD